MKYSFKNDYAEGCHPAILENLLQNNTSQQNGYGLDDFSLRAEQLILNKIKNPKAKVYLVSGGTQANLIVISAILRPHESVISANTGHILNNEAAAIEATGHKINNVETADGKLKPADIQSVLDVHTNVPHQVKPKLVYISNATEVGTLYSKKELQDLSAFCKENNLYLFMDGARLSHALAAETNDVSEEDLATLTDVFYWGATKNGALLGEAIIINNINLQEEFGFHIKQKGALLAKGRLLGIQFTTLMENDLYLKLATKANQQAMMLKRAFLQKEIPLLADTFTNQIFPILENKQIEQLSAEFDFYVWKKIDEQHSAIRLITSWATEDAVVAQFVNKIQGL